MKNDRRWMDVWGCLESMYGMPADKAQRYVNLASPSLNTDPIKRNTWTDSQLLAYESWINGHVGGLTAVQVPAYTEVTIIEGEDKDPNVDYSGLSANEMKRFEKVKKVVRVETGAGYFRHPDTMVHCVTSATGKGMSCRVKVGPSARLLRGESHAKITKVTLDKPTITEVIPALPDDVLEVEPLKGFEEVSYDDMMVTPVEESTFASATVECDVVIESKPGVLTKVAKPVKVGWQKVKHFFTKNPLVDDPNYFDFMGK